MSAQRRVVVGITGATGAVYAVRLLRRLREAGRETHLIASAAGVLSVHHELGLDRRALEQLADVAYAPGDVGAAIASGSFAIEAMVVAPCSMKSLAAIALGMGDNLLTRNAYHLYMFRYDAAQFAGLTRSQFLKALSAEGVSGSGGYSPLNKEAFIKARLNSKSFTRVYSKERLKSWEDRNNMPVNDKLCNEAVWFTQTMLLGDRTDMDEIAASHP